MLNFSLILCYFIIILAIYGFIFHNENLIMLIIFLELILLSIGYLFLQYSFLFDDLIGANFTLFFLPLAGAESAIALAILVIYYPFRGHLNLQ